MTHAKQNSQQLTKSFWQVPYSLVCFFLKNEIVFLDHNNQKCKYQPKGMAGDLMELASLLLAMM